MSALNGIGLSALQRSLVKEMCDAWVEVEDMDAFNDGVATHATEIVQILAKRMKAREDPCVQITKEGAVRHRGKVDLSDGLYLMHLQKVADALRPTGINLTIVDYNDGNRPGDQVLAHIGGSAVALQFLCLKKWKFKGCAAF